MAADESNERERFAEVVLPHLDQAYRLARWLAGERADAEDIVQEAALRALRGVRGFNGVNARAWVLSIVRNTAYGWLMKNRPAALVLTDDLEEAERTAHSQGLSGLGTVADTPEALLIEKTEAEALEKAIANLPTPFREVLVLREVQGLGYRDIAEVTGLPIGTVMSRLSRARRLLIKSLGRDRA